MGALQSSVDLKVDYTLVNKAKFAFSTESTEGLNIYIFLKAK